MILSAKRLMAAAFAVAAVSVHAQVNLGVGQTVAIPIIDPPVLEIVEVSTSPFLSSANEFKGTLTSLVARTEATGDNLIFAYVVSNRNDSLSNVIDFSVNGWSGFTTVVAQHDATSLLGTVGKAAETATRSVDSVKFRFSDGAGLALAPGTNSMVVWLLSDATAYRRDASWAVNGFTATAPTFAPVPEPATMAVLGVGLAALVRLRRRSA